MTLIHNYCTCRFSLCTSKKTRVCVLLLRIMSDVAEKYEDKYSSLLIAGYARELLLTFDIHVPQIICVLICDYCPRVDAWDLKSIDETKFIVNQSNNILKYIGRVYSGWFSAYGTQQIKPKDYLQNTTTIRNNDEDSDIMYMHIFHRWKIQIIPGYSRHSMIFGVIDSLHPREDELFCNSYGYGVYDKDGYKYCSFQNNYPHSHDSNLDVTWSEGDIAEVILLFKDDDYKHCCVGYRNPGKENLIKVAFHKLSIDLSYSLAVSMCREDSEIQIIS